MEDHFLQMANRAMSLDAATVRREQEERNDAVDDSTKTSTKQRQEKPHGIRRSSSGSKLNNVKMRQSSSQHGRSSIRNAFMHHKSPPSTPISRRRGSLSHVPSRPRSKSPLEPLLPSGLDSSRRHGSSRNQRTRSKSLSSGNQSSGRSRRQGGQQPNHPSRTTSKSPSDPHSPSRHQSGRRHSLRGSRSKSPADPLSSSRRLSNRRPGNPRPRSKSPADPLSSPRQRSSRRQSLTSKPKTRSRSPKGETNGRTENIVPSPTTVRSRSRSSGNSENRRVFHRSLLVQPVSESRRKHSSIVSPKSTRSESSRSTRHAARTGTAAGGDVSASPSARDRNENENSKMTSIPVFVDEALNAQRMSQDNMSGKMELEDWEEDDDIIEDEDEHSLAIARFRRQSGLPPDPRSASQEISESTKPNSVNDRFAASFNNLEMWMGGEPQTTSDNDVVGRWQSFESLTRNSSVVTNNQADESEKIPRTPKTNNAVMRSGVRRPSRTGPRPDTEQCFQYSDGAKAVIAAVDEDDSAKAPGQKQRQNSATKKKSGNDSVINGDVSSGRSSSQSLQRTGRRRVQDDSDAVHPSGVPTFLSPGGTAMSPMTLSITSTPTSMISSTPSRQRRNSLQALLRLPANTTSRVQSGSTGLESHFGKDEISVGATTITTNFTLTQRDRDDATVSERSLFQPTSTINPSQIPRIPQRRTGTFNDTESDSEDSEMVATNHLVRGDDGVQPPGKNEGHAHGPRFR